MVYNATINMYNFLRKCIAIYLPYLNMTVDQIKSRILLVLPGKYGLLQFATFKTRLW